MSVVNVHEAKTHLSKILERVARGVLRIGEGFDDPLPEQIARAFRGGDA